MFLENLTFPKPPRTIFYNPIRPAALSFVLLFLLFFDRIFFVFEKAVCGFLEKLVIISNYYFVSLQARKSLALTDILLDV